MQSKGEGYIAHIWLPLIRPYSINFSECPLARQNSGSFSPNNSFHTIRLECIVRNVSTWEGKVCKQLHLHIHRAILIPNTI